MFESCSNRGFRMTFKNGLMLSVQWGVGNYCSRANELPFGQEMAHEIWASDTAEIAVIGREWEFVTKQFFHDAGDTVIGHMTADEVADLISRVSKADYGIRECYDPDCRFRDNQDEPITVCVGLCPKESLP